MWTWVKPETRDILENGCTGSPTYCLGRTMALKKRYLQIKGIIPSPDDEWKVEAARQEALQKKEDEWFDSITDEEWKEFFAVEVRRKNMKREWEEVNRKKPIWPKWFYLYRGRIRHKLHQLNKRSKTHQ